MELLNPSGGAEVGIGSTIEISIQHSDQAYGVFQFESQSLEVTAMENSDSGFDIADLKVIRVFHRMNTVIVFCTSTERTKDQKDSSYPSSIII